MNFIFRVKDAGVNAKFDETFIIDISQNEYDNNIEVLLLLLLLLFLLLFFF